MPALTPTSELEAINLMLRAIGESPVNSVTGSGNVDADMAGETLRFTSRNLQKRGWHWNTLEGLTLLRTAVTNEITVPANTLKVDTSGNSKSRDAVLRGQRLFDRDNNTYSWDADLEVELVEFLAFEDLPETARSYIALSASRRFQQDRVGSETLAKFHAVDEAHAWADLQREETENGDYSIFDSYSVASVLDR